METLLCNVKCECERMFWTQDDPKFGKKYCHVLLHKKIQFDANKKYATVHRCIPAGVLSRPQQSSLKECFEFSVSSIDRNHDIGAENNIPQCVKTNKMCVHSKSVRM